MIMYLYKEELGMEEDKHMSVRQTKASVSMGELIYLI